MVDELRELDAEVAEKLMGLVPCTSDQHEEGAEFFIERPCHAQLDSPNKGGETRCYSTDIASAMEVVERMWQLGWQVEMTNYHKVDTPVADNVPAWYVRFIENEDDMNNWSADADTLPLATCKAALRAKEEGDGDSE